MHFTLSWCENVGWKMCPFESNFFFVPKPVLALRPPSVSDNLKGRYHTLGLWHVPKNVLLWNWNIFHPSSSHDELPLHRWKENNFLLDVIRTAYIELSIIYFFGKSDELFSITIYNIFHKQIHHIINHPTECV